LKIGGEFFGTAGISTQVQVGDDYYFNGTFLHTRGFIKLSRQYKQDVKQI
jgi:hypothetical protein